RITLNSIHFYSQQGVIWGYFAERCGVKAASELRLDHVLQFVKGRLDHGRSAKTINGNLSSLRSFLTFLKEENVPIHSSLKDIQRLKETDHLPRYITAAQVDRLKNEIDRIGLTTSNHLQRYDDLLIRAIFYLLWQGGLRSGEVEMLRFSDFYISKAN